jgi:hypothetical protein
MFVGAAVMWRMQDMVLRALSAAAASSADKREGTVALGLSAMIGTAGRKKMRFGVRFWGLKEEILLATKGHCRQEELVLMG